MPDLLLHPATRQQLQSLIAAKPHAILISGAVGSGKQTIALRMANEILDIVDIHSHPYFLSIVPIKQSIGIEEIRHIRSFLHRKTTGQSTIRRIILIADAHHMTKEAQNALLKSLEEPPVDTVFILTTSDSNSLKPTILSRMQHVNILAVDAITALDYLNNTNTDIRYAETDIMNRFNISGGLVGLLMALVNNKDDHEMVIAIHKAKQLLRMPPFERLLEVDALVKQKEDVNLLLRGLRRIISSGLEQSALKSNKAQTTKFLALSSHLQYAQDSLLHNANTKLVLCHLFLQM